MKKQFNMSERIPGEIAFKDQMEHMNRSVLTKRDAGREDPTEAQGMKQYFNRLETKGRGSGILSTAEQQNE